MRLNTLYNLEHFKKKSKRVGRGIGSGKGKTCGSGHKGQKARTGVAIKGFEGGQMAIIHRLPKRGFKNFRRIEFKVINVDQIEKLIKNNVLNPEKITKLDLLNCGLISAFYRPVKILAKGDLTHKINIEIDGCSLSAKEKIESLGGTVKEYDYLGMQAQN